MTVPKKPTRNDMRAMKGNKSPRARSSRRVSPNAKPMDEVRILPSEKPLDHSCIQRPPVSTAGAIRCRFLNRLGIQKDTSSSMRQDKLLKSLQDTANETSTTTTERTSRSSSFSSNLSEARTRSVSFDESVTVRPIPRYDAYSEGTRRQIWADALETYENARRNSIEFAADHFDWQHAAEEDDFVPTENGELVHPVHYARQCNMQRNFLLVMAARQHVQQCN